MKEIINKDVDVILNLDKVIEANDKIQNECHDLFLTNNEIKFHVHHSTHTMGLMAEDTIYSMYWRSVSQYLKLIKSNQKADYVSECIIYAEYLLAEQNMNAWLSRLRSDKQYIFRVYKDRIRALLSDRYFIYDNETFINDLLSIMETGEGTYRINEFSVDEFGMYFYMYQDISFYRDFRLGFLVENSEVGGASATMKIVLFTPTRSGIILNWGKTKTYARQTHLGKANINLMKKYISNLPNFSQAIQERIEQNEQKVINISDELLSFKNTMKLSDKKEEELVRMFSSKGDKMSFQNFLNEISSFDSDVKSREYAGRKFWG